MATEAGGAAPPPPPQAQLQERYRALRTVATIIRVLAFIIAILGGLGVLIASVAIGVSDDGGVGQGLATLVGGALYVAFIALFMFAYGELINLIIAVEDNTRRTAEALAGRGGAMP